MNRETRRRLARIRAANIDGQPGVTLHCIRPGVVDDYGSLWAADAFDASLALRMPTLCWSHDWAEPLGPPVEFRTSGDGPEVDFVFSDFDAVPMARRAHAQVMDGTIEDCSVGFSDARRRDPTDAEKAQYPGIREVIEEATLDEVSLVLRGAVPGAKVLAVRSGTGEPVTVPEDDVVALARRVNAGELTLADARTAMALLADGATVVAEDTAARDALLARELADVERRMDDLFSNDQSRLLNEALEDRFPTMGNGQYVWVLDFTDVEVVFELCGFADSGLFMLAYSIADGVVVLDPGDPVEVHRVTSYVPDPPEPPEPSGQMPMGGQMSGTNGEHREPEPDPAELEADVRRAMERSR